MIDKFERFYNIAMVNIELLEQELTNGKVSGEAGRQSRVNSQQVQDDRQELAAEEQDILGLAGTGD